jgi:16S rRNA (adenine1518-N6/adenine1519-N6)-dimethyltransferase
VRTRKRFGQHFLEPPWIRKVIAAIDPVADDVFLEIGPGAGALTMPLAARVRHLVAIEVDRGLAAALAPRLPSHAHVVCADVLTTDFEALLPPARDAACVRVAGNLPYNISSPVLFHLIDAQRAHGRFSDATLMLQREVADRLTARPGSREYGVLTIGVARCARVERLLVLPPGAFRPPPQVTSALVRLAFFSADARPAVPPSFDALVRAIFGHRRKTVGNALAPFARSRGLDARQALADCGLDATRRPETLSIDELSRLAARLA